MSLCKRSNLTLIVKVFEIKGLIDIEGNRITGQFGDVMDSFLETKSKRDCRLIGTYEFGKQLPNKSYDGALGLMETKKGDLYLVPSTQYFLKDFIEQSQALYIDKYMIGHRIENDKKSKEIDVLHLMAGFEINIKLFFLISTITFIIILVLLSYFYTSKLEIKKLYMNFFRFRNDFYRPFSKIGLTLIFYHLFYFLFKLIISSQITTSKVVVDTSYIINTMEKFLETKSVICWIKNDVEITMAEQSPEGSSMRRLFKEKKYSRPIKDMDDEYSDHCLLSIKRIGQQIDLKDKILFINEPSLYGFIANFVIPNAEISYWISPMIEMLSVYYHRKDLSFHQKLIINENSHLRLQSGIAKHTYERVIYDTQKGTPSKIYTNLNAFISDNSLFTNLQFSFIKRVLVFFLIANCFSIFISLFKFLIFNRSPKKIFDTKNEKKQTILF